MFGLTSNSQRLMLSTASVLGLGMVLLLSAGCEKDSAKQQELIEEREQLLFAIDSKDKDVADKSREIVRLRKELIDRDRRNIDLRDQLVEMQELRADDPAAFVRVDELKEENKKLRDQVARTQQRIEEMKRTVVIPNGTTRDEQVKDLTIRLDAARNEIAQSKEKIDALELERSKYQQAIKQYKETYDELTLMYRKALGQEGVQAPETNRGDNTTVVPLHPPYVERIAENIPKGNTLPGAKAYHAKDYGRALKASKIPGQKVVTWAQSFEVHFNDGDWLFHKLPDNKYLIEFNGKVDEHFIKHFPDKSINVPVGSDVVFIWECDPKAKTISLQNIYLGKAKVTGKLDSLYAALAEIY